MSVTEGFLPSVSRGWRQVRVWRCVSFFRAVRRRSYRPRIKAGILVTPVLVTLVSLCSHAHWPLISLTYLLCQPSVLMTRFMLNLRQLNEGDTSPTDTDAQHFSRFTAPHFRMPTDLMGNIGELLHYNDSDQESCGSSDGDGTTVGSAREHKKVVNSPSSAQWEDIEMVRALAGVASASLLMHRLSAGTPRCPTSESWAGCPGLRNIEYIQVLDVPLYITKVMYQIFEHYSNETG